MEASLEERFDYKSQMPDFGPRAEEVQENLLLGTVNRSGAYDRLRAIFSDYLDQFHQSNDKSILEFAVHVGREAKSHAFYRDNDDYAKFIGELAYATETYGIDIDSAKLLEAAEFYEESARISNPFQAFARYMFAANIYNKLAFDENEFSIENPDEKWHTYDPEEFDMPNGPTSNFVKSGRVAQKATEKLLEYIPKLDSLVDQISYDDSAGGQIQRLAMAISFSTQLVKMDPEIRNRSLNFFLASAAYFQNMGDEKNASLVLSDLAGDAVALGAEFKSIDFPEMGLKWAYAARDIAPDNDSKACAVYQIAETVSFISQTNGATTLPPDVEENYKLTIRLAKGFDHRKRLVENTKGILKDLKRRSLL